MSAPYQIFNSSPYFFELIHALESLALHELSVIHSLLKRFVHFAQQQYLVLVILSAENSRLEQLANELAHSCLEVKPVEVTLVFLVNGADGSMSARGLSHE